MIGIAAMALAAFLILSAQPASAEEPALPGFANEVLGNRVVNGKALRKAPVSVVKAGGREIWLEDTSLGEIASAFGGAIRQRGDTDDATYWLCYQVVGKTPLVITFSSGESGGDEHATTMVSLESSAAGTTPGCSSAPDGLIGIDLGVPGIGSTLAAVTKALGREKPDAANRLKYNAVTADEDGSQLQTLTYRLQNQIVTALAVTQASTD